LLSRFSFKDVYDPIRKAEGNHEIAELTAAAGLMYRDMQNT